MKTKFIAILAALVALSTAGTHTVQAAQTLDERNISVGTVDQIEQRTAMDIYRKQIEDYQKDLTAYQADPSIWTAEIPREPQKPEIIKSGDDREI